MILIYNKTALLLLLALLMGASSPVLFYVSRDARRFSPVLKLAIFLIQLAIFGECTLMFSAAWFDLSYPQEQFPIKIRMVATYTIVLSALTGLGILLWREWTHKNDSEQNTKGPKFLNCHPGVMITRLVSVLISVWLLASVLEMQPLSSQSQTANERLMVVDVRAPENPQQQIDELRNSLASLENKFAGGLAVVVFIGLAPLIMGILRKKGNED